MFWDVLGHCFVMNEVFWRFQKLALISSPNQKNEIYNLGVVPEPPALRKQ